MYKINLYIYFSSMRWIYRSVSYITSFGVFSAFDQNQTFLAQNYIERKKEKIFGNRLKLNFSLIKEIKLQFKDMYILCIITMRWSQQTKPKLNFTEAIHFEGVIFVKLETNCMLYFVWTKVRPSQESQVGSIYTLHATATRWTWKSCF